MDEEYKHKSMQVFRTAIYVLIWWSLGTAALSFSLGRYVRGSIEIIVAVSLLYLVIDGRILNILEERQTNPYPVLISSAVVLYLTIEAVWTDFSSSDLYILGKLQIFSLISYIQAAGLILLGAFLAIRIAMLLRHWHQAKG